MITATVFLMVIPIITILSLFFVKIHRQLVLPKTQCHICLVKKVTIITGGNRGMGYSVAMDFAKRGARVILACRNKEKGELARRSIIKATNNSDVVVKHLNLASIRSINTFAFEMLKTENRLDVLVNNAGVLKPNSVTEDGFYNSLQVNALGPFLLTYLLLDLLKSTRNSRVINVTTLEGTQFKEMLPNFIDKNDTFISYIRNYNNSKKCLNLLMLELAERLKYTNVSIHFSLPRLCTSDFHFYENMPHVLTFIKKHIIFYFFHLSPEESALNTIYCALSDDLLMKTGRFYRDSEEYHIEEEGVDLLELRCNIWNRFLEHLKLIDIN